MKIDLQPYSGSGSDNYFIPSEELARRCDPVEPAMGYGKCTAPYCQCNWYVAPNAGPPVCANNVGCGHPFSAHT